MNYLRIQGPTKLSGTVTISGAKNAALPHGFILRLGGEFPVHINSGGELVEQLPLRRLVDDHILVNAHRFAV